MKHKKDYIRFLDTKGENYKVRGTIKRRKTLSKEYIERAERITKEERENGVHLYHQKKKGNKLYMINYLLYNPRLMPHERLCIKYKSDGMKSMGVLRDGRKVKIKRIPGNKHEIIVIVGDEKKTVTGQFKAIDALYKMIGLPDTWDIKQGSDTYCKQRINKRN